MVDLKLFLFLVLISLFLTLLDFTGLLKFPKSLVQNLTIPIQYGFYKSAQTLGGQFGFIFVIRKAALENRALRLQLGELMAENASLRQKLTETESLVDQYNKLNPKTFDQLPARVVGSGGRYLVLDRGSDSGVVLSQVVVYKDSYIGKVSQVSSKVSQVLLAADPDSKIAVFSQNNEGRAKGILAGQFGSELLMDKILHQEKIQNGDLVYSEGSEGQLPRGLIMGRVTEVLERQNEVFKQAKIEQLFKTADLSIVFIIKNLQ